MPSTTLGQLRTIIRETLRSVLLEDDDAEVGRPRKNPNDPLARAMDDRGGTEEFSEDVGISVPELNKLARNSGVNPSLDTIVKISDATSGEVDMKHWLSRAKRNK